MEQRSDEDIRVVDWRHHELVLARLWNGYAGGVVVLALGLVAVSFVPVMLTKTNMFGGDEAGDFLRDRRGSGIEGRVLD